MTPELSQRIGRALSIGNATPGQRETVIDAARKAESFVDLPARVRRLLVDLETPREAA